MSRPVSANAMAGKMPYVAKVVIAALPRIDAENKAFSPAPTIQINASGMETHKSTSATRLSIPLPHSNRPSSAQDAQG